MVAWGPLPTVIINQNQVHMLGTIGLLNGKSPCRGRKLEFYKESPKLSFSACAYAVPASWNALPPFSFPGKLLFLLQEPIEVDLHESRHSSILFLSYPVPSTVSGGNP